MRQNLTNTIEVMFLMRVSRTIADHEMMIFQLSSLRPH